jgi:hypothetical protein
LEEYPLLPPYTGENSLLAIREGVLYFIFIDEFQAIEMVFVLALPALSDEVVFH